MVVFNLIQNTSFFTNGPQLGLSENVRARLAQEGLATANDLADFKEEQLEQAYKNMRTAIPGVPGIAAQLDANGNVVVPAVPAIQPIPPVLVSARCRLRLMVASIAYHYYDSIIRDQTPQNMNYSLVLKGFYSEYEAILELAKEDKPDVPVLHKNSTPLKWIESFRDCLYRTYGLRKTPLLYVVRDQADVPDEEEDPLLAGKAYGASNSVLDELIKRLNHDDPLYKSDNAMVYSMLEEATRGTIYATTIKPFSRSKDGRSAWQAMVSSHAGTDKWEHLFKERSKFLMNTKWNGRNYSLERFTGVHRSSFVQLQEAAAQVVTPLQLPSEHTRVGYLIDNINNSDPDLRAAIASIRVDTNGMRSNFEAAVAFLLPVDPYVKHKKTDRQVNIADIQALKNKSDSKTGVDLRWHTPDEYAKLNKDQKSELYQWQKTKDGKATIQKQKKAAGHKPKISAKKKLQAKVAALQAEIDERKKDPTLEELTACIAAATSAKAADQPTPTTVPTHPHVAAAVQLQGILKRKRESQAKPSDT